MPGQGHMVLRAKKNATRHSAAARKPTDDDRAHAAMTMSVMVIGGLRVGAPCRYRRSSAPRLGRLALRRTFFGCRSFEPSFLADRTRPDRSEADRRAPPVGVQG